MEPNEDTAFPWRQRPDGLADYPAHEGVAVWIRPCLARATHAKAMRETHGVRTVAEVDDNYLANPRFNLFLRESGWSDADTLDHLKALASQDAVIVSTDYLRDEYARAFKQAFGKAAVPPIHVCRNHVDFDLFPPAQEPREGTRLRIGYMGSDSHVWDIKLAYPTLKWAHDAGHEVVIVGYDPKWRTKFEYTHIPWIEPGEFRRAILPLDIGLCPLVVNKHTLGKSDIKPLEYALSGAASVVQNCLVYNRTLRHEEHVLLAGGREEMLLQTIRLARDVSLRHELVRNTQEYIRAERDIRNNVHEWREAVLGDHPDLLQAAA